MTARNSANESSSTEPVRSIPALLTSTSIGPPSFTMRSMPSLTDPSESTSMAEIVIGSFSFVVSCASSGARLGLRIVAETLWLALPKARAVAKPIPELAPVMRTDAMRGLLLGKAPTKGHYYSVSSALDTTPSRQGLSCRLVPSRAAVRPTSHARDQDDLPLHADPCHLPLLAPPEPHDSPSRRAFAARRSTVSNPSVNQS